MTNPTTAGSGGTWGSANLAEGGGVMRLSVAGMTTVDGNIESTSLSAYYGAGGSIILESGELSGTGTITASGYSGSSYGGGGGRLAVYLTTGGSPGSVNLRACGGNSTYDGGPGTIYLQTAGQEHGKGEVRIFNCDRAPSVNSMCQLPPSDGFTDELRGASLNLVSNAYAELTSDLMVGDVNIDATSALFLRGHTLTVRHGEHPLDGTVTEEGGQIVWISSGTLIIVR